MATSPVDIITEVLSDLSLAVEVGNEFHYSRKGDRIAVREWNDDGTTTDIKGYLTFEEK